MFLIRAVFQSGLRLSLLIAAFLSPACDEPPSVPGPSQVDPPGPPAHQEVSQSYAAMCAQCHGASGEGATGPALNRWRFSPEAMAETIDQRMPTGAPQNCTGLCATELAEYIFEHFLIPEQPCDATLYPPRQLRLLTRFEYINTVRDLLGAPKSCQREAQCDITTERCDAGLCAKDACGTHTFVYAPQDSPSQVFVAGSFNDWSPMASGYGMTWSAELGLWYLKAQLGEGAHSYKFVSDGQWLRDPANAATEPDGFGGENSVIELQCESRALDLKALTAGFPEQTRPSGFVFDNNAASGLVTSTHVTEHMEAALRIAPEVPRQACGTLSPPACAERFVRGFGARAFRRPLLDDEVSRYLALVLAASRFDDGINNAAAAMLVSPNFLYRSEIGAPAEGAEDGFALTGYELASALSYFLWGTMPDEALSLAAESGALNSPDALEAQAARLLSSERARPAVMRFAHQWLGTERIMTVDKQPSRFPDFDETIRAQMLNETGALFGYAALEVESGFGVLFSNERSFASDTLLKFYGEVGRPGRSLMTQGAVLGTYAYSDQTSPVTRGLFVRERLLCQSLGVPPAGAGGIPEVDPEATTRERFTQHSADPTCRACHRYIDEIGFGFEHFDAVGRFRESEDGKPIDARGVVFDLQGFGAGTELPFESPAQLGALLSASRTAKACFVTQLYRYAKGELETEADRCALETLRARFEEDGNIRGLLINIVRTPAFRLRR